MESDHVIGEQYLLIHQSIPKWIQVFQFVRHNGDIRVKDIHTG